MFDGLLKSKFYSKCKSAIKLTKTRIELIKRKRIAMQKFLKKDVVDLLKNGLDINAYGRIEGLWNELNFSSCYDYVEQCCTHISTHLATMDKERDCPEECKEAASSLMFAAARFCDLPELRHLRSVFTERYGNSIEFYINKEFVKKLQSAPPTRDMKIQLIQEIASESGLQWSSKTLEQKQHTNPPASAPDCTKNGNDDKSDYPKWINNDDKKIDKEVVEDPLKYSPFEREVGKDMGNGRNRSHLAYDEPEDIITPTKDIQVDRINRKVQHKETHAVSAALEEENDDEKPFYYKSILPPYTKGGRISITSTPRTPPTGTGTGTDTKGLEKIKKSDHIGEHQQDESNGNTKPKPKSVRRRNQKTWPGQDNVENSKTVGPEKMTSKGEEDGRQNSKNLNERQNAEPDEEERRMDRLLMHYSRRKLPPDTGESEGDLQRPLQKVTDNTGRGTKDRGRDGPPTRVASLPIDSISSEPTKLHARASSFQPEVLSSNGHVHPKMPDYEDFVARLAALRGASKR